MPASSRRHDPISTSSFWLAISHPSPPPNSTIGPGARPAGLLPPPNPASPSSARVACRRALDRSRSIRPCPPSVVRARDGSASGPVRKNRRALRVAVVDRKFTVTETVGPAQPVTFASSRCDSSSATRNIATAAPKSHRARTCRIGADPHSQAEPLRLTGPGSGVWRAQCLAELIAACRALFDALGSARGAARRPSCSLRDGVLSA
jgi:hypothetical protein